MQFNNKHLPSPRVLLLLLFAAFLGVLQACNEDVYVDPVLYGSVRGQVLYNTSRLPVSGALVRVVSTGRTTTTDSAGRFFIDSLKEESYTIQATKAGYLSESSSAVITQNQTQSITLFIKEDNAINRPPNKATNPTPATGAVNVPINLILRWKATDPDRRDSTNLTYDVLLFKEGASTPVTIGSNLKVDTLVLNLLQYNTTYYWQVIVRDLYSSTNGDLWSFKTAEFPEFSYYFARRVSNSFQIFAANDRGETAQLTQNGNNWRPVVSPNRQQVAFISNNDADPHLYAMNRDGSNVRRVTTVPLAGVSITDLSFCWSPDGTQLLYPSNDKLYAIRTDGTGLRLVYQLPTGRLFSGCDWTEQGNKIVARTTGANVYDNELITLLPDGTGVKSLFVRKTNRVSNPVFSVDGQIVLFAFDQDGFQNSEGRQLNSQIQLLNLTTGVLTALSTNKPPGTNDLEPRFSPNGASIIFTNVDNTIVGATSVGIRRIFVATIADILDANRTNNARTLKIQDGEMPFWR